MKMLFLMLMLGVMAVPARTEEDSELLRVEIEELRMVVRTLRAENERLVTRNRRLTDDLVNLGRLVQELRARAEAAPGVAVRGEPEDAEKGMSYPIVYVNGQFHYVIVDGGSSRGLKVGAMGELLRGEDQVLGKVTLSDVKATQSVGELDAAALSAAGVYPKPGDRVVFR